MCVQIEMTIMLPLHEYNAIALTKGMFLRLSKSSLIMFSNLEVIYIEIY